MKTEGWYGVDLDGCLAHYDGWRGIEHIGEPVPAMLERVKGWIAEGKKVKIFTARIYRRIEAAAAIGGEYEKFRALRDEANLVEYHIWKWLEKHGLPKLEITCVKDFGMIMLFDDRCTQIETNTGRIIE